MDNVEIGHRVIFNEEANIRMGISKTYSDIDCEIITHHSRDWYIRSMSKNLNSLKGTIAKSTYKEDVFSVLFSYNGEDVFLNVTRRFLELDTEYYRDEKINSLLDE